MRIFFLTCYGCLGIGLGAVGLWGFALPIAEALHTGRFDIVIKSWHSTLWFHEHPTYFVFELLTDAVGLVALGGTGLIALYGSVHLMVDPSLASLNSRVRVIGIVAAVGSYILFLVTQFIRILTVHAVLS